MIWFVDYLKWNGLAVYDVSSAVFCRWSRVGYKIIYKIRYFWWPANERVPVARPRCESMEVNWRVTLGVHFLSLASSVIELFMRVTILDRTEVTEIQLVWRTLTPCSYGITLSSMAWNIMIGTSRFWMWAMLSNVMSFFDKRFLTHGMTPGIQL